MAGQTVVLEENHVPEPHIISISVYLNSGLRREKIVSVRYGMAMAKKKKKIKLMQLPPLCH
jgi:hypothetical protein